MNRKGFTLIELLAVIIILGVIMLIAIPSVTRYINESRKDTYIDTARQIVKGAIPMVNSGELDVYDTNTTYYIPASCIPTENSMSSPFGEFKDAYVIVGYTGEGYVYYWSSVDSAHQGIEMKEYNKLAKNDVKPNMESVDTTLGIGSRTDIKILDEESCQSFVDGTSSGGNVVYPEGKTKDTVETGDIVTIGTENFYVVKHDGNDLILLSRYNLKVGNIYDIASQKVGEYTPGDLGYGIQSSEVKGVQSGTDNANGTVAFSTTMYWDGKVGTTYPGNYCNYNNSDAYAPGRDCAYVYDDNSILYQYIQSYKTYLSSFGVTIKEARLMSLDESGSFRNTNYNAWKETSYWLGTVRDNDTGRIWGVTSPSGFVHGYYAAAPKNYGVRPVIVI